jgi:hypothetical protein
LQVDTSTPGVIVVDASNAKLLDTGAGGTLLELHFRINDGVSPTFAVIDTQSARINDGHVGIQNEPQPGWVWVDWTDVFIQVQSVAPAAVQATVLNATASSIAAEPTALSQSATPAAVAAPESTVNAPLQGSPVTRIVSSLFGWLDVGQPQGLQGSSGIQGLEQRLSGVDAHRADRLEANSAAAAAPLQRVAARLASDINWRDSLAADSVRSLGEFPAAASLYDGRLADRFRDELTVDPSLLGREELTSGRWKRLSNRF